jgi:hypothetical protein
MRFSSIERRSTLFQEQGEWNCDRAGAKLKWEHSPLGRPRLAGAPPRWTILEPVLVARNLELAQISTHTCCYAMEGAQLWQRLQGASAPPAVARRSAADCSSPSVARLRSKLWRVQAPSVAAARTTRG